MSLMDLGGLGQLGHPKTWRSLQEVKMTNMCFKSTPTINNFETEILYFWSKNIESVTLELQSQKLQRPETD